MKYKVKCKHCGHKYWVDSAMKGQEIRCEICGASKDGDYVRKKEEPQVENHTAIKHKEPETTQKQPIVQQVEEVKEVKREIVEEKIDPELKHIKSFQALEHEVEDPYVDSIRYSRLFHCPYQIGALSPLLLIIFPIFLVFSIGFIIYSAIPDFDDIKEYQIKKQVSKEVEESVTDLLEALEQEDMELIWDCYMLPSESVWNQDDLQEAIDSTFMKDLLGENVDILNIECEMGRNADYYCVGMVEFSTGNSCELYFVQAQDGTLKIKPDFE